MLSGLLISHATNRPDLSAVGLYAANGPLRILVGRRSCFSPSLQLRLFALAEWGLVVPPRR